METAGVKYRLETSDVNPRGHLTRGPWTLHIPEFITSCKKLAIVLGVLLLRR